MTSNKILIVGNPEGHHLGSHLVDALSTLGWENDILDARKAWSKNRWINRIFHHGIGKKPPRFWAFNRKLLEECASFRPDVVITTGISPVSAKCLQKLRKLGIQTVNYLTDDPWNPKNEASHFWYALREYDLVANPRTANLEQLRKHGCNKVEYVPFGYNPCYHYIEQVVSEEEKLRFGCDVAILGGADDDRVSLARALVDAGIDLALYGGYWNKYPDLKKFYRGVAYGRNLRLAVQLAKSHVCMGRKANRDGHAMRSTEFPAMGASMLVEDTGEHRELYGGYGESVLYWQNEQSLVEQAAIAIGNPDLNQRLRASLHQQIVKTGQHTYADRLKSIVALLASE